MKKALPFVVVAGIGLVLVILWLAVPALSQQQGTQAASDIKTGVLAKGLDHPWGMVFLPDGRLLVTERSGQLRILSTDNILSAPLEGVPEVFAQGQGGLLDVALDPDFSSNHFVYLSYAEFGEADTAGTSLGRGKFENDRITGFTRIYNQRPKVEGGNHFGGRIVFAPDGALFLTLGERFKFDPAQDMNSQLGKIIRINPNGSIPTDNPFTSDDRVRDSIWSLGHRNIQAAAIQPETGDFWVAEMGPRGGDELNRIEKASNYGWPLVSHGRHYDLRDIPDPSTRPDLTDAVKTWSPSIAPSGMIFYTGDMFADWQGQALIGGLVSEALFRLTFENGQVVDEVKTDMGARIRDVEQAPDGSIYLLTDEDNGKVLRLSR